MSETRSPLFCFVLHFSAPEIFAHFLANVRGAIRATSHLVWEVSRCRSSSGLEWDLSLSWPLLAVFGSPPPTHGRLRGHVIHTFGDPSGTPDDTSWVSRSDPLPYIYLQ